MSTKKVINVSLNRVEGDLDISVEVENNIVTKAWCSGIMYRGIENILIGRGVLDGLVITPRICGICTTGHLTAASLALDHIAGVKAPSEAVRVRNISLMTEKIQSDMRQGFLMFTADFVNPAYEGNPLFEEAVQRYAPFKGEAVREVIRETKKIIEIIAILGGQWPHSSFMVPGGVVSVPNQNDLLKCRLLLEEYSNWYEKEILGCKLERWLEIKNAHELDIWLEESESHRESQLGFYIRYARSIGLDRIGIAQNRFLSFGAFDLPEDTNLSVQHEGGQLIPAGFYRDKKLYPFDQNEVSEHVAYSWFIDYEGGLHPFKGETKPYASGYEGKKYSWAKAPRYSDYPAETGPLAEMIIDSHPLFLDLVEQIGATSFVRQLARLTRPVNLIPAMKSWLTEITPEGKFYQPTPEITDGKGFGLTEVTRGALGHWVQIKDNKIAKYQIITPTAWNLSPRDYNHMNGPAEEALIGTEVKDIANPVELGHIIRSFDPCLVCTVHTVSKQKKSKIRI